MTPTPTKKQLSLVALVALTAAGCTPPDASRGERVASDYLRLLAAEDARPVSGPELTTLIEAASSNTVFLRRSAVRALGRLENPDLVDQIEPLLHDRIPGVRAEAANALAQAVHRGGGDRVVPFLLERAAVESAPEVQAALARSLGRTASSPSTRSQAAEAIVGMSRGNGGDAPIEALLGVALGLESLVRRAGGQGLPGEAAERLVELGSHGVELRLGGDAARIRGLAYSALGQARRLDRMLLVRVIRDPDPGVRLLAARYLDRIIPTNRPEMLRQLLGDGFARVPIEAIRAVGREPRTELYCRFLFAGADPLVKPSVRVVTLEALARPCPQLDEHRRILAEVVAEIGDAGADDWHAPAHALVALARVGRDQAAPLVPRLAGHESPFARAYAARAASLVQDAQTLETLATDPDPNVRSEALAGLFDLRGHAIDRRLLEQLRADDPQLLMTVARLLEGSPLGVEAASALMATFERISAAERETWRDARRALLVRIEELRAGSHAEALRPYLQDHDPMVAADVSAMLADGSGARPPARPEPLPRRPLPTPDEFRALDGARIVLHMRDLGPIVIAVDPSLATTNVHRFVELAEAGYFDGLTFHRWAPNFVIQGGSPHANEYQGDGPYTRDEVGLEPHWRGTVGISTRGRDTGDGQIFVNLEDNVRLNHDYTIVGRVIEGMDIVDDVLEGAVIDRAEVRREG